MSGARDLGAHVQDMIDACEKILLFTQGLSDGDIVIDTSPVWGSVLHHLVVMGEAAKHVPPGIRARRPQINWRRLAGMRDKLVHYYFGVDAGLVIDAVRQSVPEALPQLRSILLELDAEASAAVRPGCYGDDAVAGTLPAADQRGERD